MAQPQTRSLGLLSCQGAMCCRPACVTCHPITPPQKPQDCEDMPSASSLACEAQKEPQAAPSSLEATDMCPPGYDGPRTLVDMSKPQGTIVNPKELAGAMKAPIWQVLPRWVILLVGRVMQVGAAKYGAFNYRSSNVWAMTYVDAIERHMQLWQDGEDDDPETGVSHLAHVMAGCAILLDAQANKRLGDDRPVTGQVRAALTLLDGLKTSHPLPAAQY